MISNGIKHTKHAALEKPIGGDFHRNEIACIGAPCEIIDDFCKNINEALQAVLKLGYLSEDHKASRKSTGFHTTYTNKIKYQRIDFKARPEQKQWRKYFNDLDLLLVNGNHFTAATQIVFIHDKKKESLSRKLDRLTNIKMIILENSNDEIYDFVLAKLTNEEELGVFRRDQLDKIAAFLLKDFQKNIAPLYGLILAGGKSSRMGHDKGAIDYHGKAQREYEAELAAAFCNQTFISCRKNQDELIETRFKKVYDTFEGLGPFGGLLSAFRAHPNAAWLSLACDLPYLDKAVVSNLVKHRNPTKLATCFYNPETEFPEPLITIWEPKAYPVLLEFLSQGYSCPRKVLINTDIEMIQMKDPTKMTNANTDEERKIAFEAIKASQK